LTPTERVRIGVVGDEVLAPEVRRIHAELRSREIDDPSVSAAAIGCPTARYWQVTFLLVKTTCNFAVLLVRVGTTGEVHDLVALDAARARVHRVRPDRGQVVELERQDLPSFRQRAHLRAVLARVDVGEERLEPVRRRTSPAAQDDRDRRGRHLVGIDVHLIPNEPPTSLQITRTFASGM